MPRSHPRHRRPPPIARTCLSDFFAQQPIVRSFLRDQCQQGEFDVEIHGSYDAAVSLGRRPGDRRADERPGDPVGRVGEDMCEG
jgi:hypothetical protein